MDWGRVTVWAEHEIKEDTLDRHNKTRVQNVLPFKLMLGFTFLSLHHSFQLTVEPRRVLVTQG